MASNRSRRSLGLVAELDRLYITTRPGKAVVRLVSHLFFQGRYVTTRHRWLNRFILPVLNTIKHLPIKKVTEKPIFVVGTGRSGSTILGKVLSIHLSIGFLNEPKAIWFVVHPQDDVNGHFQLQLGKYRFSAQDATPQVKLSAHRILGFYAALTRSKRILDKNPEMLYRIPYLLEIFPDAKFIFLARNGWDVIHSITTWSRNARKQVEGGVADWWGYNRRKWNLLVDELVPGEPLLAGFQEEIKSIKTEQNMAAVEWVLAMQEGMRCQHRWPKSVCILRYENLTLDPRRELSRLLDFCELCQDEIFLKYSEKIISPNRSKPAVDLEPFIYPGFAETMHSLDYTL